MDIAALLRQPEGKTLEFKRDLSSPDNVLKTIVAFANTAGGIMLVGVDDKTRKTGGLADPLKEEERLASLIADRISPRLVPTLEILSWRGAQLMRIEVYPGNSSPCFLKNLGPENGVFVRLGSTNRKADIALIREMQRLSASETFDEIPLPEFGRADLDLEAAAALFSPRIKLTSATLQTLRILVRHARREVPSTGGFLLFGRDHTRRFPDAWIQCGRFSGTDKTRLADTLESTKLLPQALEEAYGFIRRHSNRPVRIDGLRNTPGESIPLRAARELLVNAIVHADYSQAGAPVRVSLFDDRLEIENPGILLAGLTIEDITQGVSRLRNRVIGRVFKELGYIEQWGSGIQRAVAACADAGLPPPRFEELPFRFRAILPLVPVAMTAPALDPAGEQIRQLLISHEAADGLAPKEIATALGVTTRTIRTRMARLERLGLVIPVGKNNRDPRRRYVWKNPA
ncbi:putative transcriptional regulator with HTH domain [Opitutaceae bacterium TAV1]|nr:transcriptional regulator [Opitutaceae bacterium TAV5]EIP98331.1 putative transcriptional regulator with HTH domain [Opitutaceae bacterium TAV1]